MLYTPLSVRYIAGIQPDAELFTGVSKLCLCILIKRWRVFSFVIENGTIISEDFSRDAIGSQNLLEYMVIGMKRFLRVTPPGDDAGGVINGHVEMPDLSANPFIRSSVDLLLLSEIGVTGGDSFGHLL